MSSFLRLTLILLAIGISHSAIAEKILLIGDSLTCGPYGKHVLRNLTAQSHEVSLYCGVSSAPSHWLRGDGPKGQICQKATSANPTLRPCNEAGKFPKLSDLLKEHPDSKVIIGLGTNSLYSPSADASYQQMAELVKAQGFNCVWVGPPHMNPAQARGFSKSNLQNLDNNLASFYLSLENRVGKSCQLTDGRPATAPGQAGNQTSDGVHRNEVGGKHWADQLFPATVSPSSSGSSPKKPAARE